jgi:four helix bundle protein
VSAVIPHALFSPYSLAEVGMAKSSSYRELRVWQEAVKLALAIYRATMTFPKHELYGLTSQMRRAAVSIPSNIAEGKGHRSDGDFGRFLFHARGSLLELQTQIVIAQGLEYLTEEQGTRLIHTSDDLGRGLNGLIQTVRGTLSGLAFANDE